MSFWLCILAAILMVATLLALIAVISLFHEIGVPLGKIFGIGVAILGLAGLIWIMTNTTYIADEQTTETIE